MDAVFSVTFRQWRRDRAGSFPVPAETTWTDLILRSKEN
jgi:hypothetical protein